MRPPLVVAVAQPPCVARDLAQNALAHGAAIRAAGARLVVLPELSLTGYELDADPVALDDPALDPIVEACGEEACVALVGAPVEEAGRATIAQLRVEGDGVTIAYRKSWPGGDEVGRFVPGDGPTALELDGWRVGLGICRDTGIAEHVVGTAALGIDLFVAGIAHHDHELPVQDARGSAIAHETGAYVAFASFAGPTGGGFDRTAGRSTIWRPDGTVLARAGASPGELARAELR